MMKLDGAPTEPVMYVDGDISASGDLRIGAISVTLQCFPCEGVDLQELTISAKPLPHLFHNRELGNSFPNSTL